jgi:hypothetical protein
VEKHLRRQEPREQRSCNTTTNYYGDRVCIWTPDDPKVARKLFKAKARTASLVRAESRDAVADDSAGSPD